MSPISRALYQAFVSLLHPRMLALMLVPVAVALGIWLIAAIYFWGATVAWMDARINDWESLQWLLAYWPLTLLAAHAGAALLALVLMPVILITAVIVTGVFAMPFMVSHVALRNYPQLAKYRGGTFTGSALNSLAALAWLVLLVVLTFPLWLAPLLWPVLTLGLLGYLNQRVFRYDALAEHADRDELLRAVREDRWNLFLLGVVVALAAHVPVLGFFSPVYAGLAFTHYALARLQAMRSASGEGRIIEGEVIR